MKTTLITFALVCMSATTARAEWRYHKTIDPLDDSEIHCFGSMPTNETDRLELSKPTMLAIRIQNGETIVGIVAMPNTITEKTFPVVIRFDRKKARKIQCRISTDHEILFPPNQNEFLEEILSCNGLIVSLDTAFGRRIDFFDLRGLSSTLRKHGLTLQTKAREPEPVEQSDERPTVQVPEPPPPDPKAVAKARATLNDIARALIYAKERTGQAPRMKSEFELTKPLAALQKAIAEHERKLEKLETTKTRYNRLNAGSISRPSANQLMRAEKEHEAAAAELERAVAHIYEQARQTLQATNWPTPELSEDADTLARQISYPRKRNW